MATDETYKFNTLGTLDRDKFVSDYVAPKEVMPTAKAEDVFTGNFSDEYIGQEAIEAPEGVDGIYSPDDERKKRELTEQKVDNASWSDKTEAFLAQAGKQHLGAAFAEWSAKRFYTNFKNDPEYNMTEGSIVATLNEEGLPMSDFGDLNSANSMAEYNFILQTKRTNAKLNKKIVESLSTGSQITASLTGALGDVDALASFGIGKLHTILRAEKIRTIAALEGTAEASLAMTRENVFQDYSVDDAIADIILGGSLTAGTVMYTTRKIKKAKKTGETSVSDDTLNKAGLVKEETRGTVLQEMEERAVKPEHRTPEELVREAKYQQAKKTKGTPEYEAEEARIAGLKARARKELGKSDEEIEAIAKQEKAGEYKPNETTKNLENTKLREYEEERIRKEAVEQDRFDQNAILAEKFKNEKYADYAANRRNFFGQQDKIDDTILNRNRADIKASKIKVDTRISKLTKELDELKRSGDVKSSKVKYREKEIKKLKKQAEDIKAKKKQLETEVKRKKLSPEERKTMRIVDDMMEDVVVATEQLRDIVNRASKEELSDMKNIEAIVDEMYARNPEIVKDIRALLGSKLANKVMPKPKYKVEKMSIKDAEVGKRLTKAQKAGILAMALGGTSASASEGDDISGELTLGFIAAVGLLVFGGSIFRAVKNPMVSKRIADAKEGIENSYKKSVVNTSEKASSIRKTSQWVADLGYTKLTSGVAPFIKAGGEVKKFAESLFFSHQGGDGLELLRRTWNDSAMAKYAKVEKEAYDEWLWETGENGFMKSLNREQSLIHEFRQKVSDDMRQRSSSSPAIKKMVDVQDEIYKDMYSRAKEYGVYGFDKISYEKGKTPRLWNSTAIGDLIQLSTESGVESMKNALAKGVYAATGDMKAAERVADKMIKNWKNNNATISNVQQNNIFELVEDMLKDDVDLEAFSEAMQTAKDASGRARNRINIDIDAIPDFEMEINGVKTKITKSMLVENDAKKMLDLVASELNGLSVIAKAGYPSVKALENKIATFPREFRLRALNMMDLVLGKKPRSADSGLDDIVNGLKDITISEKLPFVMFSVPYELLKTISNGGFTESIRNLNRMLGGASDIDKARLSQLIDMTGSSTGMRRADSTGFMGKTTDDIAGVDEAGTNIRKTTHKLATLSMIGNGLTKFTDWVQAANLLKNEEKLAKYMTSGEGISVGRANTYGLKDSDISMFKKDFTFKDGVLQKVDTSGWSINKKDRYALILKRMGQEQVLEHTIGETPLWGNTSTLGKVVNTLIGYPIMMHNIHLQNGVRQLDRQFLFDNIFSFGGSYMGLQLKYELLGKDVEDEKIIQYALMNSLPMSALSSIKSMTDPAALQVANTAVQLVDPMRYGDDY